MDGFDFWNEQWTIPDIKNFKVVYFFVYQHKGKCDHKKCVVYMSNFRSCCIL